MNPVPLLIILGTLLTLLAVQHWLARIPLKKNGEQHGKKTAPPTQPQPPTPPPRQRGRKLTSELSVTGLDERGIESLKTLIAEKNLDAITTFLAFNRPGFVEIDAYLMQQYRQGKNAPPSSSPHTLPAKLLEPLTKTEHKLLREFNPKAARLISRDLMSRFGGHEFSIYFSHYATHPQSVTLHFPPFDPNRKILEDLVKFRIARKGRHIPLSTRLTVLKMSQLRQMAKDLDLDKKFTRKQTATETLATIPGAAVLLSMQYVIDDLFMLMPIREDVVLVKHEWSYLQAYAKILGNLKL